MKGPRFSFLQVVIACLLSVACQDSKSPYEPGEARVLELISPAEGAIMDNGCYYLFRSEKKKVWDFDWTDVVRAREYHLYVIGPNATIPLIDDNSVSASSFHHELSGYIVEANRYGWRWKVRARIGGVWSRWSQERTFDVEQVNTSCTSVLPV